MKTATFDWRKISVPLLASLSLATLASYAQAGLSFNSPDLQAPGNREAGASRSDDSCLIASNNSPKALVALIPNTNIGLTTAATPTFYVYVPPNQAEELEFLLYEEGTQRLVYQKTYESKAVSGEIVAVELPEESPLAVEQNYYWYFSVVCSSDQPDENLVIESNIRRIEPSAALTERLAIAEPQERPAIYAEAGIWYETLAALSAVDPDQALSQWRSLLQSVGLEEFVYTVAQR
ncbi:MAG: DUF928 domain-containing protein [Leptolyngbyaceae cyanobacterium SM1_1_3]|nr:DUF928 domain-containing protein [Leptolyngbyaceae cyanobacterium SM1_1_3]NJO11947.1 DUF928 domain-containing protein [Leptolyngbyaceae cyanobacterium SL_1_1]